MVVVSGEGSGEVGTSYSLTCRVTLPLGVAGVSPNIQWKRPNIVYTPASSTPDSNSFRRFHTTLELNPLQSTDAGEYICQANYSLGGYTSPLVRDSLTLEVISKSLFDSMAYHPTIARGSSGSEGVRERESCYCLHSDLHSHSLSQS